MQGGSNRSRGLRPLSPLTLTTATTTTTTTFDLCYSWLGRGPVGLMSCEEHYWRSLVRVLFAAGRLLCHRANSTKSLQEVELLVKHCRRKFTVLCVILRHKVTSRCLHSRHLPKTYVLNSFLHNTVLRTDLLRFISCRVLTYYVYFCRVVLSGFTEAC